MFHGSKLISFPHYRTAFSDMFMFSSGVCLVHTFPHRTTSLKPKHSRHHSVRTNNRQTSPRQTTINWENRINAYIIVFHINYTAKRAPEMRLTHPAAWSDSFNICKEIHILVRSSSLSGPVRYLPGIQYLLFVCICRKHCWLTLSPFFFSNRSHLPSSVTLP